MNYRKKGISLLIITVLAFSTFALIPTAFAAVPGTASWDNDVWIDAAPTGALTITFRNPSNNDVSLNEFLVQFPANSISGVTPGDVFPAGAGGPGPDPALAGFSGTLDAAWSGTAGAGFVLDVTGTLVPGGSGTIAFSGAETFTAPNIANPAAAASVFTISTSTKNSATGLFSPSTSLTVYVTEATLFTSVVTSATGPTAGTSVTITATLNNADSGVPVDFSITGADPTYTGTLSPTRALTDSGGVAVTTFAPDPVIANDPTGVTITGDSGALPASSTATILPVAAAASKLTGSPSAAAFVSNGASVTTITATLTDAFSNPKTATAAITVSFSLADVTGVPGTLSASSSTIAVGASVSSPAISYTTATATTTVGSTAAVLATASGLTEGKSGKFTTDTAATTTIAWTTPTGTPTVPAGSSTTIKATLSIAQQGTRVTFTPSWTGAAKGTVSSVFAPPSSTSTFALTDSAGVATATLTPSTTSGDSVTVAASFVFLATGVGPTAATSPSVGTIPGSAAKISIVNSPATQTGVVVFSDRYEVVAGIASSMTLGVTAADSFGNTITTAAYSSQFPQGIAVSLSVNAVTGAPGTVSPSSVTLSASTPSVSVTYTVNQVIGSRVTIRASGGTLTGESLPIVTADNKPKVTVTAPVANATGVQSTPFAGTALTPIPGATIETLQYSLNAGALVSVSITSAATVSWFVTITLVSGANTIELRATDNFGNVGSVTKSIFFDNATPTLAITSPAEAEATAVRPTITATLTDNFGVDKGTIVLKLDGVTVASTAYTVSGALTSLTLTFTPTAPLSLGNHTVTLDSNDIAGNLGTQAKVTFNAAVVVTGTGTFGVSASSTDISGVAKTTFRVGEQVLIAGSLTNNDVTSKAFTFIVQIKDATGKVVFIGTFSGSAAAGATVTASAGSGALGAGAYTAQVFVWDSLAGQRALSLVATVNFVVT